MPRLLPLPFGLALLALVIGLIAYGSLYPFDWRPLPDGQRWPMALLAGLGHLRPGGRGDLLANLLLYLPLGGSLALALRGRLGVAGIGLLALLLGGSVSLAIETLQLFDAGRDTRGSDLVLNTLSSGLGVGLALLLRAPPRLAGAAGEPVALLLLGAGLGAWLFPYVPAIDLQAWKNALKPLLLAPALAPAALFASLGFWLLAAEAAAAGLGTLLPPALAASAVLLFALAAKVLVVGSQLTLSDALGLLGALALWLALSRQAASRRAGWLLALLALGVVLERLAPFAFGPAQGFGLVPFRSFLEAGGFGAGIRSGLQKLFLYGGLIWLARRAGLGVLPAAALGMALALLTSLGQIWLPSRSAEITDAVLAGLAALLIAGLTTTNTEQARKRQV